MQFTFNCLSLAGKLTNHEIPEKLVEDVKKKSREFHDFSVEEKEFSDKVPFTPIRYANMGTWIFTSYIFRLWGVMTVRGFHFLFFY